MSVSFIYIYQHSHYFSLIYFLQMFVLRISEFCVCVCVTLACYVFDVTSHVCLQKAHVMVALLLQMPPEHQSVQPRATQAVASSAASLLAPAQPPALASSAPAPAVPAAPRAQKASVQVSSASAQASLARAAAQPAPAAGAAVHQRSFLAKSAAALGSLFHTRSSKAHGVAPSPAKVSSPLASSSSTTLPVRSTAFALSSAAHTTTTTSSSSTSSSSTSSTSTSSSVRVSMALASAYPPLTSGTASARGLIVPSSPSTRATGGAAAARMPMVLASSYSVPLAPAAAPPPVATASATTATAAAATASSSSSSSTVSGSVVREGSFHSVSLASQHSATQNARAEADVSAVCARLDCFCGLCLCAWYLRRLVIVNVISIVYYVCTKT